MHQESTQPQAPSAAKPQRLPPGAEHPSLLAAMFRPGTPMLWVPSSYFAMALTIGICFGIYSSVFVAAAIAMWLGVKREDLIKPVKEKDETDGAVV